MFPISLHFPLVNDNVIRKLKTEKGVLVNHKHGTSDNKDSGYQQETCKLCFFFWNYLQRTPGPCANTALA